VFRSVGIRAGGIGLLPLPILNPSPRPKRREEGATEFAARPCINFTGTRPKPMTQQHENPMRVPCPQCLLK
jgi:hypothetical protein